MRWRSARVLVRAGEIIALDRVVTAPTAMIAPARESVAALVRIRAGQPFYEHAIAGSEDFAGRSRSIPARAGAMA